MQSLITWNELLTFLFCFLALYYTTVLALFYRHDLVRLAGRFKSSKPLAVEPKAPADKDTSKDIFEQVQRLMQDCRNIFRNTNNAPIQRDKLIESLRAKVQSYPIIKGSHFEVTMTNHIEQETENRLGIRLSNEELDSIWK